MIESSVYIYEFEHPDNPAGGRIADEMLRLGAWPTKLGISMAVIVALRDYFQILKTIIEFVAILVIGGHALCQLAYKGFCYQFVNIMSGLFEVDAKDDMQVSTASFAANYRWPNGLELSWFAGPVDSVADRPHIPKITHLIAWISFNLFPSFNHTSAYQLGSMTATGKCHA